MLTITNPNNNLFKTVDTSDYTHEQLSQLAWVYLNAGYTVKENKGTNND